tara:strand:- start:6112 stop:6747 length:636 start_codon:yes stop_codon:yes gene_type:complete
MLTALNYANICKTSYKKNRCKMKGCCKTEYMYIGNERVIMTRGTQQMEDIIQDLSFTHEYNEELGVNLHNGFSKFAYEVIDYLDSETDLNMCDGVNFTGHSAGGSILSIVSAILAKRGYNVNKITTFGEPKITDKEGAKEIMKLVKNRERYVSENDIVVQLPPQYGEHVGKEIKLTSKMTTRSKRYGIIKYYVRAHWLDNYINGLKNKYDV